MTENMSADSVQSRQAGFVLCCLKSEKENSPFGGAKETGQQVEKVHEAAQRK